MPWNIGVLVWRGWGHGHIRTCRFGFGLAGDRIIGRGLARDDASESQVCVCVCVCVCVTAGKDPGECSSMLSRELEREPY